MDDKNHTSSYNPYEVTDEDVWDVLGSIGGTSNVWDDDCEGEECEVEPIPSIL